MGDPEHGKKTRLNPLEVATLFGFPPKLQERLSKAADVGPPKAVSVELDRTAPRDVIIRDSVYDDQLSRSINYLERRIEKLEDRKMEMRDDLRNLTRAIELERSRIIRAELERSYPVRGVFTVGLLISIIGALILLPLPLSPILQFLFGAGLLLIGLSVSISSLLHVKKKPAQTKQQDKKER